MQAAIDFGRGHRVYEAYRFVLRTLSDAVDSIGLIQAAGACDCSKSELNDALRGREGRYLRIEWVLAIMDAAPDWRERIGDALVSWQGMTVKAGAELTPEQRLHRLEMQVATQFGAAGLQIVEANRK